MPTTTNNKNGTQEQDPWQAKELGVLWEKTSKAGNTFLSGTINLKNAGFDKDISVVVFHNKRKEKDSQPDLRIYISEPRETSAAPKQAPKQPAAAGTRPTRASTPPPPLDPEEDQPIL